MINDELVKERQKHIEQNFILNGGLKMYNYKISDDTTKEILNLSNEQKKKKNVDDLLSKLSSVNSQFSTSNTTETPNNIELERLNYAKKTDDEIKAQAESELSHYKDSSIKQLEEQNKAKEDELYKNKDSVMEQTKEQKDLLAGYYENAKESASNQALKRGLARSSIVINQLDAFDNKQINDYKALDNELTNKIEAINFELNGLSGELTNALNDFNISFAVKLQDKINSLTKELQEKEMEVTKYNNEIALKEAEFNKNLAKMKSDLENTDWNKGVDMLDIYGKYGSNIVSKYVQDSLYNETKNFLQGLSKEEALELLNDEAVKASLGNLYNILVKEFSS